MGEVFGNDVGEASSYQGPLDSVLNYPIYDAVVQAFGLPGPQNMTGLVQVMNQSKQQYKVGATSWESTMNTEGVARTFLFWAISWRIRCVGLIFVLEVRLIVCTPGRPPLGEPFCRCTEHVVRRALFGPKVNALITALGAATPWCSLSCLMGASFPR
jgi:hypothetical protein